MTTQRARILLIGYRKFSELITAVMPEYEEQAEIRIPLTQGIAGYVATSGEVLNIDDAYAHPLFYRGVDDSTGFRTRYTHVGCWCACA